MQASNTAHQTKNLKSLGSSIFGQKGAVLESLVLLLLALLIVGSLFFYKGGLLGVQTPTPTPTQEHTVKLPQDAVQISNCIPKIGTLWVQPKNLHNGPYYATHKGKVVALSYMYYPDEIPGENLAKANQQELVTMLQQAQKEGKNIGDLVKFLQFDIPKLDYDYWTINWVPSHPGMEEGAHFDMYFRLVSQAKVKQICPDAQAQEFYSPEVLKNAAEAGVPIPESMKPSSSE